MLSDTKLVNNKIIAVLPALNEELAISKILPRLYPLVDEVIVVDAGSLDNTAKVAKELGAKVIRLNRPIGYGHTIKAGLIQALNCGADIIVTMDSDGEHNPLDIPQLIKPIINGKADVVLGSQRLNFYKSGKTIKIIERILSLIILRFLSKILKMPLSGGLECGFRALRREVLEKINFLELPNDFRFSPAFVISVLNRNCKVIEIPITTTIRRYGKSKARILDKFKFLLYLCSLR